MEYELNKWFYYDYHLVQLMVMFVFKVMASSGVLVPSQ